MSDEVLLAATEIVLTWGPERMIPMEDRLRERFPSLSEEEIKGALQEGWKVLSEAEALAPQIKRGTLGMGGSQTLRKSRHWLSAELAGRAINQGQYYHWRETGE